METEKDTITAEMGIFSGRPNPEITLTGIAADEFVKLAQAAIGKERAAPPPQPKLGEYHGFWVRVLPERAKESGLPQEFNVFQGVVTEQSGRELTHWRDMAGAEKLLIQQAYKQGHEDLLKAVGFERPERET